MKMNIGIGCKNFSINNNIEEQVELIEYAISQGVSELNLADFYQGRSSELFVREVLKKVNRDEININLKIGGLIGQFNKLYGIDINPYHLLSHLSSSLSILGVDYVDTLTPARIDKYYPLENVIKELKKFVDEGIVKNIGLTMIDEDTLKKAHQIHPIYSVEMEYNILNRKIEDSFIKTANELGIRISVFGILAHGILSSDLLEGKYDQKYSQEVIIKLKQAVTYLSEFAYSKNTTLTALLYAYVFNKHPDFLVLSGTTKREHFLEIISGSNLKLSENEISEMEQYIDSLNIELPNRYPKYKNGKPIKE